MRGRRPGPSAFARLLLRLRPLGERRSDVEADLNELFESRVASHGVRHARRRFLIDVLSLWRRAPAASVAAPPVAVPANRFRLFSGMGGDLTYALRMFRRQPGLISTAIAGLAVSVAMTTVVFAITDAFNFRPLGVPDPDAVVQVLRSVPTTRAKFEGWSYADYVQLREAARLVKVEASVRASLTLSTDRGIDAGTSVDSRFVTGTFSQTFGGRAMYGRTLGPAEDVAGAPASVVLHHAFWRARLAADPSIVGRTLYFNGVPTTVVGVLDAEWSGPFAANFAPSVLLPLFSAPVIDPGAFDGVSGSLVSLTGWLAPTASIQQAESELAALAAGLAQNPVGNSSGPQAKVEVRSVGSHFTADDLALLSVFMTIVGLVLVLAATNVANLLLAGATTRQQEIGARLALGASRWRIVRMLAMESLLLGMASGMVGLLIAVWLTPLVARIIQVPPAIEISLDERVGLFAATVSVLVGIAAGLAPARYGARADLAATFKGGTPQAGTAPKAARLRAAFLAIQAGASVMLLVLTALFTRVLIQASGTTLGFDPDRVVVVTAFAQKNARAVPASEFWEFTVGRVRALPSVESVSLTEDAPYGGGFHSLPAMLNGQRYPVIQNRTSPDYFGTLGLRLLHGRTFTPEEARARAPVAVIASALAKDFWPAGDALGSTLERVQPTLKHLQVIGIVTDGARKIWPANYAGASAIYLPLEDFEVARMVVRIAEGSSPGQMIRDAVQAGDGARRVRMSLVSDGLRREQEAPRIFATGAGIVGGLALTLAVIGVFGVTAFVVSQRRREVGIRMAIGASQADVIRTIFRQGMRPIVTGLLVGLGLAFLGTQVVGRALAGVNARDPISFAAAAIVLFTAAGCGVLIPARRAARIDPALVLKDQG